MWKDLVPLDRYNIVEEEYLPGRDAELASIPSMIRPEVRAAISSMVPSLYMHQSRAIESFLTGSDICLATSTASGKSLVFMSCASDMLFQDGVMKCLVLYPSKALIMDQLERWKSWSNQFGQKVGFIHGEVPGNERVAILLSSRIVLMTPDVAHAWIMSQLSDNRVRRFMEKLGLLILDEAHVYEGVFGSNMAFFMRRMAAAAPEHRLIMTTATLGAPEEFARSLTGRTVTCFASEDDGSQVSAKRIVVISEKDADAFQSKVDLLKTIRERSKGRFLAFADSRRMVEQLTVASNSGYAMDENEEGVDDDNDDDDNDDEDSSEANMLEQSHAILPYRSGYEDHDRNSIQRALSSGKLAGVVSTSALELGLDIGELDLVVLLGIPATMKSFWQRVGRAGRRGEGKCILVDTGGIIQSVYGGLKEYLSKELEPNWLYLDNRRIQFSNALCAATETDKTEDFLQEGGAFSTLPKQFLDFFANELNPTAPVDSDLLELKQRAQGNPQYEFPIRSGMELSFNIRNQGNPMGRVTFSQALREAYPGAIYYYMAKPYRVKKINFKNREILVGRCRRWTTKPITRTMVFPDFLNGISMLRRSEEGFLTECEMQISEQVLGFTEKRGPTEKNYEYCMGSDFYHRSINRFFSTTGICWRFPDGGTCSAGIAEAVFRAYCARFGIDERDIGFGVFYAKSSPFSDEPIQGVTIFDTTDGSLRLTQRLGENFVDVIECAIALSENRRESIGCTSGQLDSLHRCAVNLKNIVDEGISTKDGDVQSDWVPVISNDENAMYVSDGVNILVKVIQHMYTPQGLKYRIKFSDGRQPCIAHSDHVLPLHGETRFVRVDLNTGEVHEIHDPN